MKTVYKKTIFEKMDDEIIQAKSNNKTVEKFILTETEFKEYYTLIEKMLKGSGLYYELGESNPPRMYRGIEIEVENHLENNEVYKKWQEAVVDKLPPYVSPIRKNKPDGMI